MASFDLHSQSAYDCMFEVSGLQYAWNWNNYDSLVITSGSTTNGSTTDPNGTWYAVFNPPTGTSTSKSVFGTVDGLDPETTYTMRAYARTPDTRWWYIGVDTIKTTPEETPSQPYFIEANMLSGNSIRILFERASDARYTEVHWNTTSATPDYWSGYDARTTSLSTIDISGLPYDSDIYIWLRSRDSNGVVSQWMFCDILHTSDRPNNWDWSFNIASGGPIYYNTTSGSTIYAYIMAAWEYNAFTERINEFRNYKGLSNYSFTVAQQNVDLTKSQLKNMLNQCITAINQMGFNIPAIGTTLAAQTFIDMRIALNSIP